MCTSESMNACIKYLTDTLNMHDTQKLAYKAYSVLVNWSSLLIIQHREKTVLTGNQTFCTGSFTNHTVNRWLNNQYINKTRLNPGIWLDYVWNARGLFIWKDRYRMWRPSPQEVLRKLLTSPKTSNFQTGIINHILGIYMVTFSP